MVKHGRRAFQSQRFVLRSRTRAAYIRVNKPRGGARLLSTGQGGSVTALVTQCRNCLPQRLELGPGEPKQDPSRLGEHGVGQGGFSTVAEAPNRVGMGDLI